MVAVDLHLYPLTAYEYELFKKSPRPELCLGVDDFHTPNRLVDLVKEAFSRWGSLDINTPFVETYAPLAYYSQDSRVPSTMLELRKDTYLADLSPGPGFGPSASAIAHLIDSISAYLGVNPLKSRSKELLEFKTLDLTKLWLCYSLTKQGLTQNDNRAFSKILP